MIIIYSPTALNRSLNGGALNMRGWTTIVRVPSECRPT